MHNLKSRKVLGTEGFFKLAIYSIARLGEILKISPATIEINQSSSYLTYPSFPST